MGELVERLRDAVTETGVRLGDAFGMALRGVEEAGPEGEWYGLSRLEWWEMARRNWGKWFARGRERAGRVWLLRALIEERLRRERKGNG